MEIIKNLKRFVDSNCSCYFKAGSESLHSNYCCLEFTDNNTCIFFLDKPLRCRYFEEYLMLMHPDVKTIYFKYLNGENDLHMTLCECGQLFSSRNKKQTKCNNCLQNNFIISKRKK